MQAKKNIEVLYAKIRGAKRKGKTTEFYSEPQRRRLK